MVLFQGGFLGGEVLNFTEMRKKICHVRKMYYLCSVLEN